MNRYYFEQDIKRSYSVDAETEEAAWDALNDDPVAHKDDIAGEDYGLITLKRVEGLPPDPAPAQAAAVVDTSAFQAALQDVAEAAVHRLKVETDRMLQPSPLPDGVELKRGAPQLEPPPAPAEVEQPRSVHIGQRVVFTRTIERYPSCVVPKDATGVVTHVEPQVGVLLDRAVPGAGCWAKQVWWLDRAAFDADTAPALD